MYIDAALQQVLENQVRMSGDMLSEDLHPQAVHDAALLTLAGFGLAKLAKNNGEIAWVGTEELTGLQASSSGPVDITQLMHASYSGSCQSIMMTGSLSVILKDIVAVGKCSGEMDNAWAMLFLAGLKYAQLVSDRHGSLIWSSTPKLILHYEMGKGLSALSAYREQNVQMDDNLVELTNAFADAAGKAFGDGITESFARINGLLMLEVAGRAAVELDQAGQLVWLTPDHERVN